MLELIYEPNAWISLLALTTMEIVLGIDNLVFLAILAGSQEEMSMPRWVPPPWSKA